MRPVSTINAATRLRRLRTSNAGSDIGELEAQTHFDWEGRIRTEPAFNKDNEPKAQLQRPRNHVGRKQQNRSPARTPIPWVAIAAAAFKLLIDFLESTQ